ncbi:HlyD family efflux transporter periplasmic adaptor subunit [Clostridium perfringens]|nr:HlyD family efflux transporter periplasmic adaptor subunit [Clostridium perfringens]
MGFKKKKVVTIISLVTILAITAGYSAIKSAKDKNSEEEINRPREYEVTIGDITAGTNGAGMIKFESVDHNFSQSVTIDEVYVKEGQRVAEGDKLISLSVEEIQKQINELYSSLKRANMELEQVKKAPEYSEDAVELAKLEVYKLNEEINKLCELRENPVLYSKVSGVVMSLGYVENAVTTPDMPIVVIGVSNKIFAEIVVSQNDINNIEKDQIVTLEVPALQDEKIQGKVSYINLKPNSEGNSTTYKVIVDVEAKDHGLLEGMTTNAHFILKEVKDALILSNKAIKLKDGNQVVNVKNEDGTLREITIETGFSDGKNSEILSGLKEGDTVVVGG